MLYDSIETCFWVLEKLLLLINHTSFDQKRAKIKTWSAFPLFPQGLKALDCGPSIKPNEARQKTRSATAVTVCRHHRQLRSAGSPLILHKLQPGTLLAEGLSSYKYSHHNFIFSKCRSQAHHRPVQFKFGAVRLQKNSWSQKSRLVNTQRKKLSARSLAPSSVKTGWRRTWNGYFLNISKKAQDALLTIFHIWWT